MGILEGETSQKRNIKIMLIFGLHFCILIARNNFIIFHLPSLQMRLSGQLEYVVTLVLKTYHET